jgi:inner membrane transporter RhtA
LRRVPPRVYALLISLEPVVAALIGLLFLAQGLSARSAVAIVLVTLASAGSAIAHAREGA